MTRPTRFAATLRTLALLVALGALLSTGAASVRAAGLGQIQGRIVGTDTGEPVGFADLLLTPADTTLRRVGGLSNADGTYRLEAAAGRYTLQVRALSYATQRIEGITITANQLLPWNLALRPDAIQQEEVVVEAEARRNTEAALLQARKKAVALGDAVSAEQVRKSPDRDAAEVLRRVTGLSVSEGKYVFVRGLGERYSSTEVDGVRIASPEQNKRVVPLDLLPANLVDHIVVQKTYTSDRPAEFGGGDVQVRTKDFPGRRNWTFSISQGFTEGVTGRTRRTYGSPGADVWGFGAGGRSLPGVIAQGPVPAVLTDRSSQTGLARALDNVWSTSSSIARPNGSCAATYGDEFQLFGRPLGLVESFSFSRSFDRRDEVQRFYQGDLARPLYEYDVETWTESAQLGGLSALSYRLTPRHSLHLRGLYSNSADDEVRIYEGIPDFTAVDGDDVPWRIRNTRLHYSQRSVLSGSFEGRHQIRRLQNLQLDWKLSRSRATHQQPDRREYTYRYFRSIEDWVSTRRGDREFGDLADDGRGTTLNAALPYRLGGLGAGKVMVGYDRQSKERENAYRRLRVENPEAADPTDGPEQVLNPADPDSAYLVEYTYNEPLVGLDNYAADQRTTAGYLSVDLPLGRRLRGNIGLRVETGFQDVRSYARFAPQEILRRGTLDDTDWLPSGNLTWSATDAVNVRLAASRTVSRPDLNELSPSPFLTYVGGMMVRGNPDLERARLDNYDLRVEAFPGLDEVLAAGVFYKRLDRPIEQVIRGGTPLVLTPENSESGRNFGVELEARAGLGRVWAPLAPFSLTANASFISSRVRIKQLVSRLGSEEHPLQGQADHLVNVALSYGAPSGGDLTLLLNSTGRRLRGLGVEELPDVYLEPSTSLDATLTLTPFTKGLRLKLAGKNLLDPAVRQTQGGRVVSEYRAGRSASIALAFGS